MQTLKPVLGLIGALVPILYLGSLLYYFYDVGGSVEEAQNNGLGPTLMGLGIIVLVFCLVFVVKLVRVFAGSRSGGGRGTSTDDDESGFDADAAVARYMARRSAEAAAACPAAPAVAEGGGPAKPRSFGRKTR